MLDIKIILRINGDTYDLNMEREKEALATIPTVHLEMVDILIREARSNVRRIIDSEKQEID